MDDNKLDTIKAWQGDTIPLQASRPDTTAESVTLLVGTAGEEAVYSRTAEYGEGDVADLTIPDTDNIEETIPAGTYSYMLNVVYSDGSELTFPQSDGCDDDGSLPQFIIRKRIENEGS